MLQTCSVFSLAEPECQQHASRRHLLGASLKSTNSRILVDVRDYPKNKMYINRKDFREERRVNV